MVLRKSIILCSALVLTACANHTVLYNPPAQTMSLADLNTYKFDCPHVAEQRAFLQSQLRNIPAYDVGSTKRAIIVSLLQDMQDSCPVNEEKQMIGCVQVQEDFAKRGSAQSVICNYDPNKGLRPLERPVVNQWDPLVD